MRRCLAGVAVCAIALIAPGTSAAAVKFTRVSTIGVGPIPSYGMVRTGDGVLHLVYQTTPGGTSAPNGLAARAISASGGLGGQVQALSGWNAGRPGLVALQNGTLEAVFGAISPDNVSGVWGIASSDGGATWSAPATVGTGDSNESLAYGSDVTAVLSNGTPVLTLPQAGGVVVQRGLGAGASTQVVTDATDNSAGDVDSAIDAGTGAAVAAWQSNAGSGGDFIQTVAPALGAPQKMPGPVRNELVISGRDKGPGVFAAYSLDNTHVKLVRYGGGSVSVGKAKGVTVSKLGTATGLDGRIWVMWGDDSGVALTRSNKAVTKFEPIQRVKPGSFTLHRLAGDGRLGPLDLLVDQIPNGKGSVPPAGTFYGRVLPLLSVSASLSSAHKLTVKVTDAGDPVAGAKVSAAGKKATTNAKGVAKLTLPASLSGHVTVTVSATGYKVVKTSVKA